jgi:hypothetical protein
MTKSPAEASSPDGNDLGGFTTGLGILSYIINGPRGLKNES